MSYKDPLEKDDLLCRAFLKSLEPGTLPNFEFVCDDLLQRIIAHEGESILSPCYPPMAEEEDDISIQDDTSESSDKTANAECPATPTKKLGRKEEFQNLSPISKVFRVIGLTTSSSKNQDKRRKNITCRIGDEKHHLETPLLNEAKEMNHSLEKLNRRCINEYRLLYSIHTSQILNENTLHNEMERALRDIPVGSKDGIVQKCIYLKCQCIYLMHKIRGLQDTILRSIEEGVRHVTIDISGLMSYHSDEADEIVEAWKDQPIVPPTPHDSRPVVRSIKQLVQLRDYCFMPVGRSVAQKIDLILQLDQDLATGILIEPIKHLINSVRYLQMSGRELFKFFFEMGPDGKDNGARRCPCGEVLSASGFDLVPHSRKCGFTSFVKEYFPSLISLEGNVYTYPRRRILSEKESILLGSILSKRLPRYELESMANGGKRLIRKENGMQDKVIRTDPPSLGASAEASCQHRRYCMHCKK